MYLTDAGGRMPGELAKAGMAREQQIGQGLASGEAIADHHGIAAGVHPGCRTAARR